MNLQHNSNSMLTAFWAVAGAVAVYALLSSPYTDPSVFLLGLVLGGCALFPTYLWCAKKVPGLPIFPLLAATYLWTFALPVLTQPVPVARYPAFAQMQAASTGILFLLLATLAWWLVLHLPHNPPTFVLSLREGAANRLFLAVLSGCCLTQLTLQANWLPIPWGLVSILNAANNASSTLAVLILSYRLGKRQLSTDEKWFFGIALGAYLLTIMASLLLIGALSLSLVSVIAFTLGRGRPPLAAALMALTAFGFLHLGKPKIRDVYWNARDASLQPTDYPALYFQWLNFSLDALPQFLEPHKERKEATLGERASVVQMLLLVQSKTPSEVPYLNGETYWIIPGLLVPRILNSEKLRSHEGTYRLAVTYGLQRENDTLRCTIAFGMLAEAFANFGFPGVVGLALLTGVGFGYATRWGLGVPLPSLRGLASLLALAVAVQAEYTAGVLVTVLFQSGVILFLGSLALMGPQPCAPGRRAQPLPEPA